MEDYIVIFTKVDIKEQIPVSILDTNINRQRYAIFKRHGNGNLHFVGTTYRNCEVATENFSITIEEILNKRFIIESLI